jgi:NTE family protein
MGLRLPSLQTYGSINKMIDKLVATNNYRSLIMILFRKMMPIILKLYVTEDDARHF